MSDTFDSHPRVLHLGKFYPPSRGGIESLMEQSLLGLHNRGMSVSGLVFNQGSPQTIIEHRGGIRIIRLGSAFELAGSPVSWSMLHHLQGSAADIVRLHWPNPSALLSFLASGSRAKLVFAHHSDIIRQKFLGLVFAPFLIAGLRRASSILVTSRAMIDASPYLRPFRHKCVCIPYGIDVPSPSLAQVVESEEIRRRFPGPIILGVGRLVYYKGFKYLIQAMREIDATLLIVGDGPLRSELSNLANETGILGKVHLLGKLDDVRPYYLAADVFALPSVARSEGFGIVQLEAMADSIPVVNTRLSSTVPYVSLNEKTGLTVSPSDVNSIAFALRKLLRNPKLNKQFGHAGMLRYHQEFHTDVMIQRLLEHYRNIVSL